MRVKSPEQPSQDRQIRVFISSTFRDMQAERDYLVKFIFPELRRLCESRGVVWGEVDLRWGVTDEQKAEGKVLPICLEEIKRCRPYFIGLLGERYGWIPETIADDLLDREPWLREQLHGRKSVTELEIIHGVLHEEAMHGHAYFYFRDPRYVETVPAGKRPDLAPENDECTEKLHRLKGEIRHAREEQVCQLREDYRDPKQLGDWIREDFTRVINELFPAGSEPDPLDREALDHEAYAQSRKRVYIGRPEYFTQLDAHAAGTGDQPLVILGESGSGKSALLANWVARYRPAHPDVLMLQHYIGATPYSADWAAMLRRILGEFKRRLGIQQDIPDKPDALRSAFANWLHMAAAKGRVVLVLDALNQLEDRDGAPDLLWLPPVLPANVRLVVSTLPGRSLDEIKKRHWPELSVKLLNPPERKQLIAKYLAQSAKHLSPNQLDRIANAPQAANPLYLRVLLDELRLFGRHEELDQRIGYYLQAESPRDLYRKVIARWEDDYGAGTTLVRDTLSLLWAARRGLSEAELLGTLGTGSQPLPRAVWSPLFLAMADALVSRGGLLTFAHDFLRTAVGDAYLLDDSQRQRAHTRLANYFQRKPNGTRRVDELPWQLAQARKFGQLHDLLRDLDFFQAAAAADPTSTKQYWATLEHEVMPGFRMAEAYRSVIENPAAHRSAARALGALLNETGHWKEYAQLSQGLAAHYRDTENLEPLSVELGNQASLLIRKGALDDAVALLREQRQILNQTRDPRALEVWLGTMSMLMWERGDLAEAWTSLTGQETILRELEDKNRLTGCLIQKSFILHSRGQHQQALALLQEAMRLAQEDGNVESRQAVLGEMAANHQAMGDVGRALKLFQEQADLCRQIGDLESLAGCFGNQGNLELTRGDQQKALALYQGMEKIGRGLGHSRVEHVGRASQALVFFRAGDLDRAEQLLKGIPVFFRSTGMKDPLWHALRLEGSLRLARGHVTRAIESFTEAVEICGQLSSPAQAASLLRDIAGELLAGSQQDGRVAGLLSLEELEQKTKSFDRSRQRSATAIEFLRRAVTVDPVAAVTYQLLGFALETVGHNEEALAAYRQGLALRPGWTDVEVRIAELLLKGEGG